MAPSAGSRATAVVFLSACALGCGGQEPVLSASDGGAPTATSCAVGELRTEDGTCVRPGVPPASCAPGMPSDGNDGCAPLLPPSACAAGSMALPGETACADVAPCGSGSWDGIPVDDTTSFVDASYTGGASDGTRAKPWTTITQAVAAAPLGAIVAIGAGTYAEDVSVTKRVRLWGVCPRNVQIAGTGTMPGAITIRASGVEVHGLGLTGKGSGVALSGGRDVLLERVWIHDTERMGIYASNEAGITALTLRRTLIEHPLSTGMLVRGAQATIEASSIRDAIAGGDGTGRGIDVQFSPVKNTRASVQIAGSLFERNQDVSLAGAGADLVVDSTLVRDTLVYEARGSGRGISVGVMPDTHQRSSLTVRSSIVQGCRQAGVVIVGSDAVIENSVVRDTNEGSDGREGVGIAMEADQTSRERAILSLRASLVDKSRLVGLLVMGSDADVERLLVRRTSPQQNADPATIRGGRGIQIQYGPYHQEPAEANVRSSVVEDSVEAGVAVVSSHAKIDNVLVRDTIASAAGDFGDGVVVTMETPSDAAAEIAGVRIERSARSGVACFGSSASLSASVLDSNKIDLNGETLERDFELLDLGGNVCQTGSEVHACKVVSSSLVPPRGLGRGIDP